MFNSYVKIYVFIQPLNQRNSSRFKPLERDINRKIIHCVYRIYGFEYKVEVKRKTNISNNQKLVKVLIKVTVWVI